MSWYWLIHRKTLFNGLFESYDMTGVVSCYIEEIPFGTLAWQWSIPMFNRKYIFKGSHFSIAILLYIKCMFDISKKNLQPNRHKTPRELQTLFRRGFVISVAKNASWWGRCYKRLTTYATLLRPGDSPHGGFRLDSMNHDQFVVEPTHLKNMRKSNWIISPGFGVKIKNTVFELPPPRRGLFIAHLCEFSVVQVSPPFKNSTSEASRSWWRRPFWWFSPKEIRQIREAKAREWSLQSESSPFRMVTNEISTFDVLYILPKIQHDFLSKTSELFDSWLIIGKERRCSDPPRWRLHQKPWKFSACGCCSSPHRDAVVGRPGSPPEIRCTQWKFCLKKRYCHTTFISVQRPLPSWNSATQGK